jgi:hypothetical protein
MVTSPFAPQRFFASGGVETPQTESPVNRLRGTLLLKTDEKKIFVLRATPTVQ